MKISYLVTLSCFNWSESLRSPFIGMSHRASHCIVVDNEEIQLSFQVLDDYQDIHAFLAAPSGLIFIPYQTGANIIGSGGMSSRVEFAKIEKRLRELSPDENTWIIGVAGEDYRSKAPVRNWFDFPFANWITFDTDKWGYVLTVEHFLFRMRLIGSR